MLLQLMEIQHGHLITTQLLLLVVKEHIVLVEVTVAKIDHHVIDADLAFPATLL